METIPLSTTSTETSATSGILKLLFEQPVRCGNIELKEKLYADTLTNKVKLFKNDTELTVGITDAISAYLYDNEHWAYKDSDDYVHLYKNSTELTVGIKTLGILRHPQTDQWFYSDEKNRLVPIPIK